jgi:hypothetical protein
MQTNVEVGMVLVNVDCADGTIDGATAVGMIMTPLVLVGVWTGV